MADPANVLAVDDIALMTGMEVRPAVASREGISALVTRLTRLDDVVQAAASDVAEQEGEAGEVIDLQESAEDAPVIKLLNSIIAQAVEEGASDIHLEPDGRELRVRFRVDGVLASTATVPRRMVGGIVSRAKIMAELDISERRLAQDGRVGMAVDGRAVDIRVVTLPTVHGESVVMRILDRDNAIADLDPGHAPGRAGALRAGHPALLRRRAGHGPTGSGKSTTLYAALMQLNTPEKNIITIEDPVEYQLDGLTQIQVNLRAGLNFSSGLRSMMQADPDIIMVGEIRDRDTAQIAIEAALTGHLVLSTLHTSLSRPSQLPMPRADMELEFDFADLLLEIIDLRASDLHISAGAPPMIRVRGSLQPVEGYPVLTTLATREVVYSILSNDQRQRLENDWQLDFAYAVPGRARFRVNAYFQRSALGAAFRLIPNGVVAFDGLGLPPVVADFARKPRGLVLFTGPTGSGKSTSLASLIDLINQEREEHIMTIEDPIEFLHQHKRCLVNQRELGADATSFAAALKAALRQDPDVILVGEMRDLETISTALTAAETGHLVFATLHTQDAPQTVDRMIDVFPAAQQQQIRVQLSVALQGIVTQQLIPTADGNGRCCAAEVLVPTPGVRNLIREGKTHQIYSFMQTGGATGMQTMDAALATLVRQGQISRQVAESRSSTPEELRRLLGASSGPLGAVA